MDTGMDKIHNETNGVLAASAPAMPQKLIIDTDPGIVDDSMAIMMAFQSPELEILGLTTIFVNVTTKDDTRNALLLGGKGRVADFVHGSDGLGNIFLPSPKAQKFEKDFVLGGAFFALRNVNPAAEGNIYGDAEAADVVFTSGANIVVVGINITTQVKFTGKYAQIICDMCKFYRDWHVKSDGVYGIFLHDPVSFVALVCRDLFTYKKGVVRVETQGIYKHPWTGYAPIEVAWAVDVEEVLNYIRKFLMKP
ncbi:hypothetical protein P3X46_009544 [Hevea brasiliensis]|uniref:Inosine/uridine-preferring nucleoside hydrolase domain-containing protein n=1 Tax=Hevea brasiliensis TaxID=3981 RepID=A0ABQ9MMC4_HEVBR|nr:hypothetical protein P3X46_009544 [Hevea brasiliensis]